MSPHSDPIDSLLRSLSTDRVCGLTSAQAKEALAKYGENKLRFAYDVGSWREGGRGGRVCNIDVELQ